MHKYHFLINSSRHLLKVNDSKLLLLKQKVFLSTAATKKMPYIEKAKLHGVQSLLGKFSTSGFYDDTLSNLEIVKLESNGEVLAKFQVQEHQCNSYKTLHGG